MIQTVCSNVVSTKHSWSTKRSLTICIKEINIFSMIEFSGIMKSGSLLANSLFADGLWPCPVHMFLYELLPLIIRKERNRFEFCVSYLVNHLLPRRAKRTKKIRNHTWNVLFYLFSFCETPSIETAGEKILLRARPFFFLLLSCVNNLKKNALLFYVSRFRNLFGLFHFSFLYHSLCIVCFSPPCLLSCPKQLNAKLDVCT